MLQKRVLKSLPTYSRYLGDGSHPSKAFASTSFEGQIGSILKKKQTRDNSADGPISSTRNDTDAGECLIPGSQSPVSPSAQQAAIESNQPTPKRTLGAKSQERSVPSTPIARFMGFASLGASLAANAVTSTISGALTGNTADKKQNSGPYSRIISEKGAETLAAGLCRMRGAALKLGQMLSIQDESVIPPQLQSALERVRAGADYMPRKQLEAVLKAELGSDWPSKVADFDFMPMAAASIGQVHKATTHDGRIVAMKIQYPGVAESIESDMDNLMRMMKVANVLPKGLFVDNVVKVMKKELALECDYDYEMKSQAKFKELIRDDDFTAKHFIVPAVIPQLSSKRILTSEWAPGMPIDKITLKELFTWRFMQTDPNWGNFLYDDATDKLALIDFGAAREYPKKFTEDYLHMVKACADKDRSRAISQSKKLGFLTGDESEAMLDAHCETGFIVGLPFASAGDYDFAAHSKSVTERVTELGLIMLKHRLCPPPEEGYSLHRKLSGAFLCCIKLGSVFPSKDIFDNIYNQHVNLG